MRVAVLELKNIDRLTGYKPTELDRLRARRGKLIAAYQKDGQLISSGPMSDGETLRYEFLMHPTKQRKCKPAHSAHRPPLDCYSEHKPYYTWRYETAQACTCRKHTPTRGTDRGGQQVILYHPDSYGTTADSHAPGCKSLDVLRKGGFIC